MERTSALLLAAALLAAGTAANAQGLTRAQVRAELDAARRNGDMVSVGETGLKDNELHPDLYPAKKQAPGKTRQQVQAELAQAVRDGSITVGESGLPAYDLRPDLYPHRVVASKTRAEVKAELAEAIRTGDMLQGGESSLTLREAFPQRYAGSGSHTVPGAPPRRQAAASSGNGASGQ